MLARIKFASNYSSKNIVKKDELDKIIDFLGEDVSAKQMKLNEDGKPESVSYGETFDKTVAEERDGFKLVTPSEYYEINSNENFIVDLERFTSTFPNLEITIKGVPKSVGLDNTNLISHMNKIAEKIEDAKNRFDKVVEFNQRCDVHVSNLGLMSINKLAFATDYCTEELQRLLHQGWRLIAVCPQPDQRRPDYILGMNVSDINKDVEVKHFSGDGIERN